MISGSLANPIAVAEQKRRGNTGGSGAHKDNKRNFEKGRSRRQKHKKGWK